MSLIGRFKSFTKVIIFSLRAALKNALFRRKLRHHSALRINFGCGAINDSRFINIDARPFEHVDLMSDDPMLPDFEPGSVDLIYASHVFEHITYHHQHAILFRWHALLKKGGILRLSVPDFDKILEVYVANDRNIKKIQAAAMGGQDYAGNFHCALFNQEHLISQLRYVGFDRIAEWNPRTMEPDWPADLSWEEWISLNIQAEKS